MSGSSLESAEPTRRDGRPAKRPGGYRLGVPPPLLATDERGLACAAGRFHIDPWRPAPIAVITHAHADHARAGSGLYYCAASCAGLLRRRLGPVNIQPLAFGERVKLGGVWVSLHPAGHVLGSAQARIEGADEVWVVSGDYKRARDDSCESFEVVACDVFISEATFALPIYRWDEPGQLIEQVLSWWRANRERNIASVLMGYSLGKAQRILAGLWRAMAPAERELTIHLHGAVDALMEPYRAAGIAMPTTAKVGEAEGKRRADADQFRGALVIAPPSAAGSPWMRRFGADAEIGFASGWMRVRGARRRGGYDRGFVISDHADWPDLLRTIRESGARRVLATHGSSGVLARYLNEQGLETGELGTAFGGEGEED
ncbi:MAG: ligase-associated DNA damage response exonuclease [Phycisphaerales bacterium]|nr:ligase-associated DNA damage response exonuclease [Phycisphaerales bacterium]